MGNEKSIFRTLISRINALRKIRQISSFNTRKMIANGIVMSRLTYLIQLWGGCPQYLLDLLQTLQNKAARVVCNQGIYTPVRKLLENCGWMSMRQLVSFHRVLLMYKIRKESKPQYFAEKFRSDNDSQYKTRFIENTGVKKVRILKNEDSRSSFVPSSIDIWNKLPVEVRKTENVKAFKVNLMTWIKENVEI